MLDRWRGVWRWVQATASGDSFLPQAAEPCGRLSKEDPMDPTHDRVKSSGGTPSEASQPIRFAGSVLDAQRHVCAFFHNPDEKYRVLLPFIKDGFDRGEKAFHIVDPKLRAEHRLRLAVGRHRCGGSGNEWSVRATQLG
jgi:hypothetical protein